MAADIRAIAKALYGSASPQYVLAPPEKRIGDLLIAHAVNDSTSVTLTTPNGWTLVDGPNASSSHTSYVFARFADGTSADNFSAVMSGSANWITQMVVIRDTPRDSIASAIPFHAQGNTASATTHVAPAISQTEPFQLVLTFWSADAANAERAWTGVDVQSLSRRYMEPEGLGHQTIALFAGPGGQQPGSLVVTGTIISAEVGNEHVLAIASGDPVYAVDQETGVDRLALESPSDGFGVLIDEVAQAYFYALAREEDGHLAGELVLEESGDILLEGGDRLLLENGTDAFDLEASGALLSEGLLFYAIGQEGSNENGGADRLLLESGDGVLISEEPESYAIFYAIDLESGDRLALEDGSGVLTSEEPESQVAASVTVTPGLATLVLTPLAPIIQHQINVGKATLTLATFAPVIGFGINIGKRSLTLTTFAPSVLTPVVCTPGKRALTLTTFAPAVTVGVRPSPTVRALTLTTFAPAVLTPVTATPAKRSLTLTTFAPSVTVGIRVTPGLRALALTTFAPTIAFGIVVPKRALVLTTFAPTIQHRINVPLRALTLTRLAPVVTATNNVTVVPGVRALTLTRFAPTILGAQTVLQIGGWPTIRIEQRPVEKPGRRERVRTELVVAWQILPREARGYAVPTKPVLRSELVRRAQRATLDVAWETARIERASLVAWWAVRRPERSKLVVRWTDSETDDLLRIFALTGDEVSLGVLIGASSE